MGKSITYLSLLFLKYINDAITSIFHLKDKVTNEYAAMVGTILTGD